MSNKSNVDVAFDIVSTSSQPISFKELWARVMEIQEISGEDAASKVGAFYTSLLLDGRFINLGDNTWDLRSRYTFEKATLDTNECYSEDEDDTDINDDPEEKEDEEEEEEADDSDDEKSEYESEPEM